MLSDMLLLLINPLMPWIFVLSFCLLATLENAVHNSPS